MLRNRPRASVTTTTKQAALMADQTPNPSPTTQKSYTRKIQFLFGSPRFRDFAAKALLDAGGSVKSPTSVLDAKPIFPFLASQAKSPSTPPEKRRNLDHERIGLAIIDALAGDETLSTFGPNKRLLFGRKLRVEIPGVSPTGSPESPGDFGIKTRNLQPPSCFVQTGDPDSPSVFAGMELSEEYTCVISRGPNPKTTHIFDNYVVDSHWVSPGGAYSVSGGFLSSYCHTCKKNLEPKADIFTYRGEKAFCSQECRYQEMLLDDGEES